MKKYTQSYICLFDGWDLCSHLTKSYNAVGALFAVAKRQNGKLRLFVEESLFVYLIKLHRNL